PDQRADVGVIIELADDDVPTHTDHLFYFAEQHLQGLVWVLAAWDARPFGFPIGTHGAVAAFGRGDPEELARRWLWQAAADVYFAREPVSAVGGVGTFARLARQQTQPQAPHGFVRHLQVDAVLGGVLVLAGRLVEQAHIAHV